MSLRIRAMAILLGVGMLLHPSLGQAPSGDAASTIRKAVAKGDIVCKLTEPSEITALIGKPAETKERSDGGMLILQMTWSGISAEFGKFKGENTPFTLLGLSVGGKALDIGCDRQVVLRTNDDLRKLDRFFGLEGVSLVRLDLRTERALLEEMNFDTRTAWPPKDRLPEGFDPISLIRTHQGPGLGIRSLHARGIDGRGVGVAIIDQPLLLGHKEYTSRILRYDATGLDGVPTQMHGSPVASILVGETVGVAPRASLTYFAVAMWKQDNLPYVDTLQKIFALNSALPADERIRVVSVSTGMFPQYPHFEQWRAVLAEAQKLGILVVTCDRNELKYGILACRAGQDPDDRGSYAPSVYVSPDDALRVPGAGRTLASYRGEDVYTLDRRGGMSWGAPYIAGLAALAFQVAPKIQPRRILQLLIETTVKTDAGHIVNPSAFIEAVEKEEGLAR